jgi:hypothetical protein
VYQRIQRLPRPARDVLAIAGSGVVSIIIALLMHTPSTLVIGVGAGIGVVLWSHNIRPSWWFIALGLLIVAAGFTTMSVSETVGGVLRLTGIVVCVQVVTLRIQYNPEATSSEPVAVHAATDDHDNGFRAQS